MDVVSGAEDMELDLEKELERKEIEKQLNTFPKVRGEVCKFFQRGNCVRKENCPFTHVELDRKTVVCKHWLRGLCKKGEKCEFLHVYDLKRMPECYFFSKFGECSNPDCLYLHVDPESTSHLCPWYSRGFCKHGPRCRYRHLKKPLCPSYYEGFCPLGTECKLGHPKFDIPGEREKAPVRSRRACERCGDSSHTTEYCRKPASQLGGSSRGYSFQGNREGTENRGGAKRRPLESVTCYKCGEKGHYANSCPMRGQRVPRNE